MTWLYVPETSSPYAQVSEALNSASSSLSSIGERLAEASATWRGKLQPPQAWSRRWKQGGFIRRLSGLTCEPSTLDRGVEQFISSLRATPAKTTPSPESAPGPMASASSPPRSLALPKSAGLMLSSERTSRGTRTNSSPPSLHHWRGWACALRQEYSARPALATPCDASDCSSWLSATVAQRRKNRSVSDNAADRPTLDLVAQEWTAPQVPNGGRSTDHAEQVGATLYHNGKKVQMGLEAQVKQWRGPSACSPNSLRGSGQDAAQRQAQGHQVNLQDQAASWPGPQARDHKGVKQDGQLDHNARPLNEIASHFRPPSYPDQPIAGGSTSSTDSPNSNQPSVKRKLNPIFVEALMRWPTGLSGFERQETAWTRWLHVQLSFLSALYSASEVSEEQYDMFGAAA